MDDSPRAVSRMQRRICHRAPPSDVLAARLDQRKAQREAHQHQSRNGEVDALEAEQIYRQAGEWGENDGRGEAEALRTEVAGMVLGLADFQHVVVKRFYS